jgi:hypothetical protein
MVIHGYGDADQYSVSWPRPGAGELSPRAISPIDVEPKTA